eukprot:334916_1
MSSQCVLSDFSRAQFYTMLEHARFWLTSSWNEIREDYSEFFLCVVVSFLFPTVLYWGVGSVLTSIDLSNPKFSMNYKIQDRANSPLDRHRLWVLIKSSIWNTPVLSATVWLLYYFCDPT